MWIHSFNDVRAGQRHVRLGIGAQVISWWCISYV